MSLLQVLARVERVMLEELRLESQAKLISEKQHRNRMNINLPCHSGEDACTVYTVRLRLHTISLSVQTPPFR